MKFFLRIPAFAALLLASLGPTLPQAESRRAPARKNILLAVDLSHSMNAGDVQPSRLQRAKFELGRLIQALPQDRFGLLIFTSGAYLQCPLTADRNVLGIFFQALSSRLLTSQGTALRPMFELALEKLRPAPAATPSPAVLVVVTDGEDFGPAPTGAIRQLRRQGIQTVLLGVGTVAGAEISTESGPVLTRLDRPRLLALANDLDAPYFEITDAKNEFPALTIYLETLKSPVVSGGTGAASVYVYFLAAALLLLVADVLLTIRVITL